MVENVEQHCPIGSAADKGWDPRSCLATKAHAVFGHSHNIRKAIRILTAHPDEVPRITTARLSPLTSSSSGAQIKPICSGRENASERAALPGTVTGVTRPLRSPQQASPRREHRGRRRGYSQKRHYQHAVSKNNLGAAASGSETGADTVPQQPYGAV
ncbi:hypothetical protein AAFF_G00270850 [Aldrovandia affinis]|uniref:Uncharacterized protein n=1 Tax=Aldrovandia affinis TaxID=143900 RepID=A0AAD7RDP2_9TELE|nr:hypothetical protein AAFF_G00270850 [Aldrovandia affinis]